MWSVPSHTGMYQNESLAIPDEAQVHPVAEKNFAIFCFTFRYMYGLVQNSVKSMCTYLRLKSDHLDFISKIYFWIPVIVFNIYVLIPWVYFLQAYPLASCIYSP